jgi:hypothetical protein
VRQDEPNQAHTHNATHTIRHPRRRPDEVSRARESKAPGPDADLEEAGRGRPDPPRRRPRGGQQCFGEGSAAPTARPGRRGRRRKAQANGAAKQARPEKARPGKARPNGAARKAQGRKRKAGSAWHGAAEEARPKPTARDRQPRRRTRRAQSCGACPALDADLEEVRRAGRDAELEEFSRAPGRAQTKANTDEAHTARQPRRRPEEVSRARESSGQGARLGQRRCETGAA